jgi:phage shock protein A
MTADIAARLRAWRELHLTRLGALMDEAADHIDSLRREVRTLRLEIAGLREERRAILGADSPPSDRNENPGGGWIS